MMYMIGEALRDLRVRRGYTQEELCYGICSRGNLSKIETGNRIPRWYTIEALIHRLGEIPHCSIKYVNKKERRAYLYYKYIINCLINERLPDKDIRKNVENFESDSILVLQFKRMVKLLQLKQEEQESIYILNELVNALKMTVPNFAPQHMDKCFLLSYIEIFLLYHIALSLYELENKAEAWIIMLWLKSYVENRIIDLEEKVKIYQMLIYRESLWTKMEKQYEKAMELCNLGIRHCVKYDKIGFLVKLLGVKSSCLSELKSYQEAEKYSVQARTISEIMHLYKEDSLESEDVFYLKPYMP